MYVVSTAPDDCMYHAKQRDRFDRILNGTYLRHEETIR